jgi:hypothetical protein
MIASVGARLLDGFAKKQTEQFLGCIRGKLRGWREASDAGVAPTDARRR